MQTISQTDSWPVVEQTVGSLWSAMVVKVATFRMRPAMHLGISIWYFCTAGLWSEFIPWIRLVVSPFFLHQPSSNLRHKAKYLELHKANTHMRCLFHDWFWPWIYKVIGLSGTSARIYKVKFDISGRGCKGVLNASNAL